METVEQPNELRNETDEMVLELDEGAEEDYRALVDDGLQKVNAMLKLNRELACGIDFGHKYSEIH